MLIDTATLKQTVSCQAYLASKGYTLAGRGEEKWLPSGCPLCGTAHPGESDRFRVWQGNWWCRNCGNKGDVITLAQMLDKTDFIGAATMLGTVELPKVEVKEQPKKPWSYKDAAIIAKTCHEQLMASHHIGQQYLESRGITPQSWRTHHLGFTWGDNPQKQPAIVIPWVKGRRIVALHYRYVELPDISKPRTRLDSQPRSQYKGNLYGGHAAEGPAERRCLVLCEGEFNAISIWQAGGDYIDVLSVGSESMTPTPEQCQYIKQYSIRLAWMDKPEKARSLAALIGGRWVSSERLGGDANDLLKQETLGVTLAKVFLAIAGDNRKDLVWALSGAELDEATKAYCQEAGIWN